MGFWGSEAGNSLQKACKDDLLGRLLIFWNAAWNRSDFVPGSPLGSTEYMYMYMVIYMLAEATPNSTRQFVDL